MQNRIKLLDEITINQIAAGEVIENPSSVVKELVENSLDANASIICIEIIEGGRQLIRISDNGYGMNQEDALLSLERHATSKIEKVHDIQDLHTMGFRGEAIPSIAAISKFSLLTSPQDEKHSLGTLLLVEGGQLLDCQPAARDRGTTIEVKSLFYNVPVRRKFQKSPQYDTQAILKIISLLALAHPTVQFELISDKQALFKTSVSQDPNQDKCLKRVSSVLGKEIMHAMLPLTFKSDTFTLEGFIGNASLHRVNRTGQYIFINQRAVSSSLISLSVREGYGTMLPQSRFPVFVLYLTLTGSLVDVNVHPQKKEVRIRQEAQLKEGIIQAVQQTLQQQQHIHTHLSALPPQEKTAPPPFWGAYANLLSPSTFENSPKVCEDEWQLESVTQPISSEDTFLTEKQISDFPSEEINKKQRDWHVPLKPLTSFTPSLFENTPLQMQVIGTIAGYIIVEPFQIDRKLFKIEQDSNEGGLALVDQRAAYARIHFEKLKKHQVVDPCQTLLIPLTFSFSPQETDCLLENSELLKQIGFHLRQFGENTFILDAFPLFMKESQLENCLTLLVQELHDFNSTKTIAIKREEKLALVACRASLPQLQRLTNSEAQHLLQQLSLCEIQAYCPWGKPIFSYVSLETISKWFQK